MPPINGNTASYTRDEQRAKDPGGHPCVLVNAKLKVNDGVYPVGLILKRDADGITFVQAAADDAYAAVLDTTVDTAVEDSGLVVIHGGVKAPLLKIGAVAKAAPDAADFIALQAKGIFPQ